MLSPLFILALPLASFGQEDAEYVSVSPYDVDKDADSLPAFPPAAPPAAAGDTSAADTLAALPEARAPAAPPAAEAVVTLPEARALAGQAAARPSPMGERRVLGAADLERGVSAFADPIRFARTLPGAGRGNDWETEISVRGGSPDQTGFLVDGIPLARVSHYEGMHGEHGGIGILNLAFVDSVIFHPGTFPARFPDRLSGLVEVDYRDGDARSSHQNALTDVTGAGGAAEGPLPEGQGSYAAAARYSAMDLLIRSGMVKAYGVPDYFNGQARVTVPMGAGAMRARIVGGGEDWSNRFGSTAYLDMEGHSLASSLSFESGEGSRGADGAIRSPGSGRSRIDLRYEERFQRSTFSNWGGGKGTGQDNMTRLEYGRERRWGASLEHFASPHEGLSVGAGVTGEAVLGGYHTRYGGEASYVPFLDTVVQLTQDAGSDRVLFNDGAAFAEGTWTAGKAELYAGYRHFYEQASDQHAFQPRLAATFRPARGHALRAAFGVHSQPHDYSDLSARADPMSARLPYMVQSETGWEWSSAQGASFSLDAFAKEGYRLARESIVPSANGFAHIYRDTGRTRARGVEAFLKTPRNRRWDATLGYAYLWYRERDAVDRWRPGPYSLPHNINLSAGMALIRSLWLTGRFSAGSGTPYTPFDTTLSKLAGTGVYDPSRAYAGRGAPYSRVDARLDWDMAIKGARVALFAEVENVLNHRNESGRQWNVLDGGETPIEGMGRLPVAGASVRF